MPGHEPVQHPKESMMNRKTIRRATRGPILAIAFVTVLAGTVTFYDDQCVGTTHPAGSSFVESGGDTGLAHNESDVGAVIYVTYLVPTGTPNSGLRIDQANPGCPQS